MPKITFKPTPPGIDNLHQTPSVEYIAGLFDGEGSVYTNWNSRGDLPYVRIQISGAFKAETLAGINIQYGGSCYIAPQQGLGKKSVLRWRLCQEEKVEAFLKDVRPFLIEKRDQADTALMLIRLKKTAFRPGKPYPAPVKEEIGCLANELRKLKEEDPVAKLDCD